MQPIRRWIDLGTVTMALGLVLGCSVERPTNVPLAATTLEPSMRWAMEARAPGGVSACALVDARQLEYLFAGWNTGAPFQDPEKKPADAAKPAEQEPRKSQGPVTFEPYAFPPTVPDTAWHQNAWWTNDCLRCHETGVGDAPALVHEGMGVILKSAKCRSCHVLIPGSKPRERVKPASRFEPNAFPPMIPASARHRDAWIVDNCLMCHDESRIGGAPLVKHEGLPPILLRAKCRSCHVQVRTLDVMRPGK